MRKAVNLKMMMRKGYVHFLEKNGGHVFVEMLTGMNNDFLDSGGFSDDPAYGSCLYELWPGTNYSNNLFQEMILFNSSLS